MHSQIINHLKIIIMGTPAKATVTVGFETEDQAKAYFKIMKDFNSNIVKELNILEVDTDICNIKKYDAVHFELHSGRVKNLEWQLEWAIHFAKKVGGCNEFCSDVWIMSDGLYFTDKEDIEDYTPKLN